MPAIVIVIVLFTGIVVLYNSRHDPCWIFGEVYDHSQPAARLDVLTIEALPARNRVQRAMVGPRHHAHDHVDMIQQPRTSTSQVPTRARIEDHESAFGVGCTATLIRHGRRPYPRMRSFLSLDRVLEPARRHSARW